MTTHRQTRPEEEEGEGVRRLRGPARRRRRRLRRRGERRCGGTTPCGWDRRQVCVVRLPRGLVDSDFAGKLDESWHGGGIQLFLYSVTF